MLNAHDSKHTETRTHTHCDAQIQTNLPLKMVKQLSPTPHSSHANYWIHSHTHDNKCTRSQAHTNTHTLTIQDGEKTFIITAFLTHKQRLIQIHCWTHSFTHTHTHTYTHTHTHTRKPLKMVRKFSPTSPSLNTNRDYYTHTVKHMHIHIMLNAHDGSTHREAHTQSHPHTTTYC
jgi:hypothetical protein